MYRSSARRLAAAATVAAMSLLAACGSSSSAGSGTSAATSGGASSGTSASGTSAPGSGASGGGPHTTVNGVTVAEDPAAAKLLPSQFKSGISIVTSAPFPPFEEFGPNNKLQGLDIDTGNALAAALGTKANFSSIDFNGVIPALSAGKYDLLLADTGDNAARAKALDFVEYSLQGEVLVVPSGNPHHITGLKSMCGLTLSVENGDAPSGFFDPVQKYCASNHQKPMTIKTLPTTADALLALTSGGAQAQFVGVGAAPALAKQVQGSVKVINEPGMTGGYAALYVGVGLPKQSPLLPAVEAAMRDLLANGTLKQLFAKYGLQDTLIPSIKVNAVSSGGQGLKL